MTLIEQLREMATGLDRLLSPEDRTRLWKWKYRSDFAFVLGEGRTFESQPLTAAERAVLDAPLRVFHDLGEKFWYQQCYANSQLILQFDLSKRLQYAEGFILDPGGLPALHSWLVLNEKVIDFTGPPSLPLPEEPPQLLGEFAPREYLGVIFPREQVLDRYGLQKGCGSLIDDDERGSPLLRHGRTGISKQE